jgi:diadenosine tetraphosphatase ApaH/serine/threonine PP2A family protein phosphatase
VGYGADPEACLARLQSLEAVSVSGNHDWACVGKLDLDWFNEPARQAILWTRDRLSFADLDCLRRLPLTVSDGPLTLVHGTFRHPERFEYLIDVAQAVDTVKACQTDICFVGHTHVPFVIEHDLRQARLSRVLTSSHDLAEARWVNGPTAVRYVMNPGSVGQPRDGDPRASVAVLDTEAATVSIQRVTYDIPAAQEKIRRAGLPGFLAERLAIGR